MTDSTHRLLVSVPELGDPNFEQSVVFIVEHNDDGALGLVLNQPDGTDVLDHLPSVDIPLVEPAVCFRGGPVSPGSVLALGRRSVTGELRHAVALTGPVVLVDIEQLFEGHVGGVDGLRIFAGYSGWSPGQLDAELDAGVWFVVDAGPDDVLCSDPAGLWRNVLRRQGGRLGAVARYPEDPNVN